MSRSMFEPRNRSGAYYLVLQITGGEEDMARLELDADSVSVRDDLGRAYTRDRSVPSGGRPVSFSGGLGYVIPLPPMDPRVNVLRSIAGNLIVDSTVRRPFRITNVPLPISRVSRIFGRMTPRRLSTEVESALPAGFVVLRDADAERAVKTSDPVGGEVPPAPQRLAYTSGVPASVGIPMPAAVPRVVITAWPGQMGRIDVLAEIGTHKWRGKIWESDVIVLVMPRDGAKPRAAAAFCLSRDPLPPASARSSSPTFVPDSGRPGGAIISRTMVGSRPFGRGTTEIELRQWQPEGWSEPRVASAAIGADGSVCVSNLAPGVYCVRRPPSGLLPDLPAGAPPVQLASYLQGRFGVSSGKWTGEQIYRIEVRSGHASRIPPLVLTPLP